MQLLTTLPDLHAFRGGLVGRVALVPTMGALHAGHLSHIARAKAAADHVIVSVFVNPTQFGPNEDFERYPRTFEADVAACDGAGAAAVFAPSVEAMYPPGVPAATVDVPAVADDLEGAQRPRHFGGVCRVVLKLLNLVRPDAVTFGRKDYQQLTVVRAMIRDLMLPVGVIEVPTTYEPDGLAMSSRNRYLSPAERERALGISQALRLVDELVEGGERDPAELEQAMRGELRAFDLRIDYAVVRDALTLAPVEVVPDDGAVALVAARVGGVRLIDNARL